MLITSANLKSLPPSEIEAEIVPCSNGLSTMMLAKDGKQRYLHSKYDPVKEARAQVSAFAREHYFVNRIIVFGIGMGYAIYELLNTLPPYGEMFVFEPNSNTCRLFFDTGSDSLLEDHRIQFFSYADNNELSHHLSNILTIENCDAFALFASPAYVSIFPKEYNSLVNNINQIATGLLTSKRSIAAFGKSWSISYLSNYPYLFDSAAVSGLFRRFEGRTAVIVAAGPSLAKNVHLLAGVLNRCVIISTDTAYRTLQQKNIRPHLLVSVSGSPKAYAKLADTDYGEIPLVYKSQTAANVLAHHQGKRFYARFNNAFLNQKLEKIGVDPGLIESGGSVACSCLDLAVKMGFSNILFIGQDLAHTAGASHTALATSYVTQSIIDTYGIEVPDIHGEMILTLQNLNHYRIWIEQYIERTPDVRFIDATEGGALIHGTEILTLEEAIRLISPVAFDGSAQIDQCFHNRPLLNDFSAQKIRTAYEEAYTSFLDARRIVLELLTNYESKKTISRDFVMHQADQILGKTAAVRYAFLTPLWQIKNMRIGRQPEKESMIFSSMLTIFDQLEPYFKHALEVQ